MGIETQMRSEIRMRSEIQMRIETQMGTVTQMKIETQVGSLQMADTTIVDLTHVSHRCKVAGRWHCDQGGLTLDSRENSADRSGDVMS